MKYLVALLAVVFAVAAASPADVAPIVAEDGYFIEDGADATDAVVGAAVADARAAGGLLYVVVLNEEPSAGATTYSDAVLDRLPRQEGTVLTVAPVTVGWASAGDIWTEDELNDALDAPSADASSDEFVTVFVDALLQPASGGSTGLWIFVGIIVLVAAGIAVLVWRGSQQRRAAAAAALDDMKAKAQAQIDALANDILDDENEIADAGNEEATNHFDAAATVYRSAAERLDVAATPVDVLEISADLDVGIWHLDAAEAILDGSEIPPRPEPPAPPETAPPSEPVRPPVEAPATDGPSSVPPLTPYTRRSTRRTGFGADDMLKTMLAMQAMRGVGRSSRRSAPSTRSASKPKTSQRTRGGRKRRG